MNKSTETHALNKPKFISLKEPEVVEQEPPSEKHFKFLVEFTPEKKFLKKEI